MLYKFAGIVHQSPPRPPTFRNKQIYTCSCASWTRILLVVGPILFLHLNCFVLMRLKESGPSLFGSEEIWRRTENKVESESVDVRV